MNILTEPSIQLVKLVSDALQQFLVTLCDIREDWESWVFSTIWGCDLVLNMLFVFAVIVCTLWIPCQCLVMIWRLIVCSVSASMRSEAAIPSRYPLAPNMSPTLCNVSLYVLNMKNSEWVNLTIHDWGFDYNVLFCKMSTYKVWIVGFKWRFVCFFGLFFQ